MLFGSAPRLPSVDSFSVSVEGYYIKHVFKYKYLGVVVDETLSSNADVKYVLCRTGKKLGILNRIRKNITMNTANVIYKSFILPISDYCDIVWNCCGKVNTNSIEKLQRQAARIIMRTTSSDEALHYLRYDTLEDKREKHTYNLVRKSINGLAPQIFNNNFTFNRDVAQRITRQSNLLHLPRVRSESTKSSFYYHGCVVYNHFNLVFNN